MHGVGTPWIIRAFEKFGHPSLFIVPSQREPDASFPTVSFPNPEEKGALNEAMKFADENECQLILANDPDADRLAVAEKQENGRWRIFSGNEVGVLLGYWQIIQWKKQQETMSSGQEPAAVLASVVSSRMLKKIASTEGLQYYDTLTGSNIQKYSLYLSILI
jgi:phosphomannomutase